MDLSSMIRPTLHRITSTFASTNSYGGFISRVLSFTGSFNDRTSLLQEHDVELWRPTQTEEAAAAPPPPPAAPEAAAPAAPATTTAASHPFDIEAGTTTPLAPTAPEGPAEGQEEPAATEVDAESRRVGKSVQTVCLFAASASLVLFANLPSSNKQQPGAALPPATSASGQGQHPLLYCADMAFISLGFFSSLGLSMFSIVARPGGEAAVARVQKWGMVVAVASVVVAFSLRVCMMPAAAA
ncbi:unnamed protein product [Miscanthus lutarioriparius]|uniref:Uncharacterized protein n=1 Tax=Miscanthus lutarioriparius TaxID=422564 RepID=A0A811NZM4_9POAL|nr:unnamed protein product [Miscanthus lutarioriparius]